MCISHATSYLQHNLAQLYLDQQQRSTSQYYRAIMKTTVKERGGALQDHKETCLCERCSETKQSCSQTKQLGESNRKTSRLVRILITSLICLSVFGFCPESPTPGAGQARLNNNSSATNSHMNPLVLHIAQSGRPRTATTLQFQLASVSLILHISEHDPELLMRTFCTFAERRDAWDKFYQNPNVPQALKSHMPFPALSFSQSNTTMIFSTAKTKAEGILLRKKLEKGGASCWDGARPGNVVCYWSRGDG